MTSINGSKCHWNSILFVVNALVCIVGTSNVWQDNVRPKLYVELGEYIHKIIPFSLGLSYLEMLHYFCVVIIYKTDLEYDRPFFERMKNMKETTKMK